MSIKYPSKGVDIQDANNAVFEGQTLSAGSNLSKWYDLKDAEYVTLAVDVSSQTGALDVQLQQRFGGQSSVYSFPNGVNSGTQAALGQITSDGAESETWRNFLPTAGQAGQVRFNFVVTTGPVTIDQAVVGFVERTA